MRHQLLEKQSELAPEEVLIVDYSRDDGQTWNESLLELATAPLNSGSTPRANELAAAIQSQRDAEWQDLPVELQQAIEVCQEYRDARRDRRFARLILTLVTPAALFLILKVSALTYDEKIELYPGLFAACLVVTIACTLLDCTAETPIGEKYTAARQKIIALAANEDTNLQTVNPTLVANRVLAGTRRLQRSRRRYQKQELKIVAKQQAQEEHYARITRLQDEVAATQVKLALDLGERSERQSEKAKRR